MGVLFHHIFDSLSCDFYKHFYNRKRRFLQFILLDGPFYNHRQQITSTPTAYTQTRLLGLLFSVRELWAKLVRRLTDCSSYYILDLILMDLPLAD